MKVLTVLLAVWVRLSCAACGGGRVMCLGGSRAGKAGQADEREGSAKLAALPYQQVERQIV